MQVDTLRRRMRALALCAIVAPLLAAAAPGSSAEKKTVCTVTVNSSDEKEAFRRNLPADRFQFVELVERGRPDWLASACSKGIRCDVLVISGHYDGGNEFFSERVDTHEFLPVDEMDRASCSDSCSGLFSQLKEVYLFGCNTLNPEALAGTIAEFKRSFVRSGHSDADAERRSRALNARYSDSSRDRMRHIFANVPLIYGFSSVAPLGPTAAFNLNRYLQSGGVAEVGGGRASSRLLGSFSGHSLATARGSTQSDPDAAYRRDVCQFADDRLSAAQKLRFVHQLFGREMAEVRMFLGPIEKLSASLGDGERDQPPVAQALEEIAGDRSARMRYLDFARNADPPVRARLIDVAHRLNWLSADEREAEIGLMIADLLAKPSVTAADVDLVCTLNKDNELEAPLRPVSLPATRDDAGHLAIYACLGSPEAHARVLQALIGSSDEDAQIAQAYLRHRPIVDVNELRAVAAGITRMGDANAQVRALDALAPHRLSDPESLDAIAGLFPRAKSVSVQRAIAGILIRADHAAIAAPELARSLRQTRLRSPSGEDVIDVLIRRLEPSS